MFVKDVMMSKTVRRIPCSESLLRERGKTINSKEAKERAQAKLESQSNDAIKVS